MSPEQANNGHKDCLPGLCLEFQRDDYPDDKGLSRYTTTQREKRNADEWLGKGYEDLQKPSHLKAINNMPTFVY
ncbi:hypothetical protein ACFX13_029965 [Malus domestica]